MNFDQIEKNLSEAFMLIKSEEELRLNSLKNTRKVEALECPDCNSLYRKENELEKCMNIHRKEKAELAQIQEYIKLRDRVHHYINENLKGINATDLTSSICEAARLVGINICVDSIIFNRLRTVNPKKNDKSSQTEERIVYCASKNIPFNTIDLEGFVFDYKYEVDISCSFSIDRNLKMPEITRAMSKKHKIDKDLFFNFLVELKEKRDLSLEKNSLSLLKDFFWLLYGVSLNAISPKRKVEVSNTLKLFVQFSLVIDESFKHIKRKILELYYLESMIKFESEEKNKIQSQFDKEVKPVMLVADLGYQIQLDRMNDIEQKLIEARNIVKDLESEYKAQYLTLNKIEQMITKESLEKELSKVTLKTDIERLIRLEKSLSPSETSNFENRIVVMGN